MEFSETEAISCIIDYLHGHESVRDILKDSILLEIMGLNLLSLLSLCLCGSEFHLPLTSRKASHPNKCRTIIAGMRN